MPEDVPTGDAAPVRYFRVKTRLRQRLGIPPGLQDAQTPFDAADNLALTGVLARLAAVFPAHGLSEVSKLHDTLRSLPGSGQPGIAALQHTAHDLAGQGGTFGFPLVTRTAKSLYRLLDRPTPASQVSLELIRTHIQLLQLIFNNNYQGDAQADVHKALKGLEIAVDKAFHK